ncbi:MAG: Fe/S biosis protein nfuA, partial [Pseudomonadota bacterium]
MFIQTEPTPNPNALKFLPGRDVASDPRDFVNREEAEASPLAEALFGLDGVAGVFFGYDYVSVTRSPSGPDWAVMKAPVLAAIMDHFVSGAPLLRDGSTAAASAAGEDTEIVL